MREVYLLKKLITIIVSAFILSTATVAAQDSTPAATPEPVHERCIAADNLPFEAEFLSFPELPETNQLVPEISDGEDITLSNANAVLSEDEYDPEADIWFVAAEIEGAGMEDGTIGVWAATRIDADGNYTGDGLLFSVDEDAAAHTLWGPGEKTPWELMMSRDGAANARECAEGE